MDALFSRIKTAVAAEHYLVGNHAYERMAQRGILEWQVVAGLQDCRLERERPDGQPNPVVEVCELMPDGTEFTAVWSLLPDGWAKLVTVYFHR